MLTVSDGVLSTSDKVVILVGDTVPPVITAITEDQTIPCTNLEGEEVELEVTARDLVSGLDLLTYKWYDEYENLISQRRAAVGAAKGIGSHTFLVIVSDAAGNEVEGRVVISIEDVTAPVITAALEICQLVSIQ